MSTQIANQLFLAYLGRAADVQWQSITGTTLNSAAPSVAMQTAFYNAAIADGRFAATDTPSVLVNKIFQNLFGFGASAFEQTQWGNLISNGTMTAATAAWTIFSSYLGATNVPTTYQQPVQSKLIALEAYTRELERNPTANAAYSVAGSTAAASGRTFLDGVTSQATAATAVSGVATTVSTGAVAAGSSFTMTSGADNFTGTSGNDTFVATASDTAATSDTYSAVDTLSGGAGTDTLSLTVTGTTNASTIAVPTVSGIEVINVRATLTTAATVTTVAAGTFGSAATNFNANLASSAVTFTGLTASHTAGMIGNGSITNGNLVATWGNTVTATNFAFSGGTTAGNVTQNGTGATSSTITSSGAANTVGTITYNGTNFTGLTINASTNLTTGNITGFTGTTSSITVSGAASSVNIGTIQDTTVSTVNASGLTGGLTATLNNVNTIVVTGGQGNDIITTAVALASGGLVNAGAGTDRLVVAATAHLNSSTLGARYTNFEVIQAEDNTAIDLANISGITAVRINDNANAGGTSVTNMSATAAANVTVIRGDATGAITLGVSGASNVGQIDTIGLTIDDGASTVGTIALGTPVMTGVEKLTINALDSFTIAALTSAASLDSITITGVATGVTGAITTGANSTANFVINGAAATGALTLDASGYTTNGVALLGGAGADSLLGGAGTDSIVGGAGNDTIGGGVGNDTVTGGTGVDRFQMTTAVNNGTDRITDFTTGTSGDVFAFSVGATVAAGASLLLQNGNSANVTNGATVGVRELSAATTLVTADNVLVVVGTTFANAVAMRTALSAGGSRALTTASNSADNDDMLVVWSDGTLGYISVVNTDSTNTAWNATASVDVATLTGVTSITAGQFVAANFAFIA